MDKKDAQAQPMQWRDAVEFLIELARISDPASLPEWQRLKVTEDLRRFLSVEGEGRVARQLAEARSKPATLKPVIEVVRQLAEAAADRQRAKIELDRTTLVFDGARTGKDRLPVFSDGLLRDVVADAAAGDLGEAEPWEICRCRQPDCRKLFLAARKGQVFCSHGCASAASVARYQERKRKKPGRK